jgi:putative endonuclease
MATVYILYSASLDRYYTGSCLDLNVRLAEHLGKINTTAFTAKANDWVLFFSISDLDYKQARRIESHI